MNYREQLRDAQAHLWMAFKAVPTIEQGIMDIAIGNTETPSLGTPNRALHVFCETEDYFRRAQSYIGDTFEDIEVVYQVQTLPETA